MHLIVVIPPSCSSSSTTTCYHFHWGAIPQQVTVLCNHRTGQGGDVRQHQSHNGFVHRRPTVRLLLLSHHIPSPLGARILKPHLQDPFGEARLLGEILQVFGVGILVDCKVGLHRSQLVVLEGGAHPFGSRVRGHAARGGRMVAAVVRGAVQEVRLVVWKRDVWKRERLLVKSIDRRSRRMGISLHVLLLLLCSYLPVGGIDWETTSLSQ